MRRGVLGRLFLWLFFALAALTALTPAVVAWQHTPEYDFWRTPLASWFVFIPSGLVLLLELLAIRFWRRARQPGEMPSDPVELNELIPAICGYAKLDRPEFLALLQTLFGRFPDIRYVHVDPLPGGYGGSTTVLARLQQAQSETVLPQPFVVKLGARPEMAAECAKFDEFVRARLLNVPNFHNHRYAGWGDWAGVAYEFAGLGGEVQNFYQFYQGGATLAVAELIEEIYEPLNKAWYKQGNMVPTNLYDEYDLLRKKRDQIVAHVLNLIDETDPYRANLVAAEENLRPHLKPGFDLSTAIPWYDPVTFLRTWLPRSTPVSIHRAIVHGDLNSRNILVESKKGGSRQVWLIDFSHTGNGLSQARTDQVVEEGGVIDLHRGHTLRDFCRLEADVKFLLTRLKNATDLYLATAFEKALMEGGMELPDLQLSPPRDGVLLDERFQKAWQVVREIRRQAISYMESSYDLYSYYFALLHATLPVIYYHPDQFENEVCELQQKRYALVAAGMLCSKL